MRNFLCEVLENFPEDGQITNLFWQEEIPTIQGKILFMGNISKLFPGVPDFLKVIHPIGGHFSKSK